MSTYKILFFNVNDFIFVVYVNVKSQHPFHIKDFYGLLPSDIEELAFCSSK